MGKGGGNMDAGLPSGTVMPQDPGSPNDQHWGTSMKIRIPACMRECLVVVALAAVTLSTAAFAGPARVQMTVNGTVVFDQSKTFGTNTGAKFGDENTTGNYSGKAIVLLGSAYSIATAEISTAGSGDSSATTRQTSEFPMRRPAGAAVAGGKLVLSFTLDADLTGKASVDSKVTIDLVPFDGTPTKGEASIVVPNQPGRDTVQVEVTIPIASDFPSTITVPVYVAVNLDLTSAARIEGAAIRQSSRAEAGLKAIGFRVFNAAGAQVQGFSLAGGSAIPELPPPPPGQASAEEFFNPTFSHYFITANPVEIANLKSGIPPGWVPTGQQFNVFVSSGAGLAAVCRFFSGASFAPKSSHFYTADAAECTALQAPGSKWTYEGVVFYAALPDGNGGCPAGQIPVYRLYNNGMGGAPNHRFTTSQVTQLQMIAEGYVREGPAGVGWCSPV